MNDITDENKFPVPADQHMDDVRELEVLTSNLPKGADYQILGHLDPERAKNGLYVTHDIVFSEDTWYILKKQNLPHGEGWVSIPPLDMEKAKSCTNLETLPYSAMCYTFLEISRSQDNQNSWSKLNANNVLNASEMHTTLPSIRGIYEKELATSGKYSMNDIVYDVVAKHILF